MLRIQPDPTFKKTVEITVPGREEPGTLALVFRYKNGEELDEYYDSLKPEQEEPQRLSKREFAAANAEVMFGLIESWGFEDEYNLKNLAHFFLCYPAAMLEITNAYHGALFKSRVKN